VTPRPPLGPPLIELTDIARSFQVGDEEVHALAGVSETIATGDHVAIMGPSGSGKSTLLHLLGCLDRPSAGSYRLAGRDVSALDDHALTHVRRDEIGFVFQFFHLVPRLTAAGNVELPMLFAGIPAEERRRRVERALAAVGLTPRADHRPDQLSGGERQRVALARATVMGPRLLLADEPTGNLDSASGRVVLEMLERLNREGLTLIVVTHDPAVARRARRILVLRDGEVVLRVAGEDVAEAVRLITEADPARPPETPAPRGEGARGPTG
jgi:putative ABC transport system ATP-binding protein